MLSNPPSTGDAKLDNFLKSVKRHIDDALRPKDGWRLSDFSADVSEVISDKRDLIDIVTRYDDINAVKDSVDLLLADYAEAIADQKAIGEQYEDHAEVFTHTMEWWNQNRRIIEDAAQAMAATVQASDYADAAEASAVRAGNHEDGASKAKDDAVTAKNQAVTAKNQASTSATNAATSASNAKTSETNAKTSETRAKTSETNAKTSETRAKTSETNAKTSETNAEDAAERAKTSETTATGHATQTADDRRQTGEDRTQTGLDRQAAAQSATSAATSADKAETHEDTSLEASAAAITAAVSIVNDDTTTSLMTWTADAVGGRNLALRRDLAVNSTHQTVVETGETFWTGEPIYHGVKLSTGTPPVSLSPVFSIEPGETYTISLWVKGANLPSNWMNANILFYELGANRSLSSVSSGGDGKEWTRIEGSYTNTTGERHERVLPYFYLNRNPGEETYYTSPKLERGPRATPWTPAPEDLVQSLLEGDPLSSLPSPFPAHDPALSLRADGSVGTRVFVGDTMIHGETGWRDISTLTEGIDFLRISRTGNRVSIVGGGERVATGGTFLTKALPTGFIPANQRITRGYMVIESAMYPVGNTSSRNRLSYQTPPYASSVAVGDQVDFEANWITSDPWPATLPGTPI